MVKVVLGLAQRSVAVVVEAITDLYGAREAVGIGVVAFRAGEVVVTIAIGLSQGIGVGSAVAVSVLPITELGRAGEERRVQWSAVAQVGISISIVVQVDTVWFVVCVGVRETIDQVAVAVGVQRITTLGRPGEDRRIVVVAVFAGEHSVLVVIAFAQRVGVDETIAVVVLPITAFDVAVVVGGVCVIAVGEAAFAVAIEVTTVAGAFTKGQLIEVEVRLIGAEVGAQHRAGDEGLGAVAVGAIEAPVLAFKQLLRVHDAAIVRKGGLVAEADKQGGDVVKH